MKILFYCKTKYLRDLGRLFSRDNRNEYAVAGLFPDLSANIFPNSEDIANASVRILEPHVDDRSVVRDAVEGSANLYPSFPKFCAQVIRERDVRAVEIGYFFDDGSEFV